MYAIIITAKTTMDRDEVPTKAIEMANAQLQRGATAGLVQKTFIYNGNIIGGFLLYTDRASAEAFLAGEFWAHAKSRPGIRDVDIHHYEVCDEASKLVGTPHTPISKSVAA